MSEARAARRGLTLVEILVSTTLVAFLIATATAGFVQMRNLSRRVEARQQLHNSARVIYERMSWELSCLMQGAACFATSNAADGSVELVFMRGKQDNLDFTLEKRFGDSADTLTDQVWTRWYYKKSDGQVTLASNKGDRWFALTTAWTSSGYSFFDKKFRQLPTLQRAVAGSAEVTLNANAYGSGDVQDYGDYDDLLNNTSAIAGNCTAFAMEIVYHDGSTSNFSDSTTSARASDGLYVDGRGGSTVAGRPRLIRIRMELTDPATLVSEAFSFSFLAPALSPP